MGGEDSTVLCCCGEERAAADQRLWSELRLSGQYQQSVHPEYNDSLSMMIIMKSLMLLVLMMTLSLVSGQHGQCEEISIPMCKDIGYNHTRFPNQFNHESQEEVS